MVQHSETAAQTGTIVGLESPQELQKMSIEQLNELASNKRRTSFVKSRRC